MRIRLLAVAAVLTLAAAACGEEGAEPAASDKASESPTESDSSPGTSAGAVVLDQPWLIQLASTHENEMGTTMVYLRVTPSTGASTSRQVQLGGDSLGGNHHTLVDGSGSWAIPGNYPADPKRLPITSLAGDEDGENGEDIVLDLRQFTPKPEAVSFDPSRDGVLRVLGEDDSLTDYDLATGEKMPVNLGRPGAGQEYHWWFSSEDGQPLPGARGDDPELGEYQPRGAVAGDPEAKVCPDEYGGWMLSYPFTDPTGKQSAVCQNLDDGPRLQFMERSGTKWKQVGTADVTLPTNTEIYAVIPAVDLPR
ncbi:hypothetical protein [Nocardioides speluncae]|uniref:hypothetical protein n=1 Tax=Nocardioides speluncae TaxID=2670337 RepID=UPI0012B16C48|nr:hypothetical protein [Nocardioides speluncae]